MSERCWCHVFGVSCHHGTPPRIITREEKRAREARCGFDENGKPRADLLEWAFPHDREDTEPTPFDR